MMTSHSKFRTYFFVLLITFILFYVFNNYSYTIPQGEHGRNSISKDVKFTLSGRLAEAEANWKRGVDRRQEALPNVSLQDGLDSAKVQMIYDFFYPTFDCHFTRERIGRVGDGGKWVCGFIELVKKPKCIVYSFGVSHESTFEQEILERTQNCRILMFDPTIGGTGPQITKTFPRRAVFRPIGISEKISDKMVTLKSAMTEDGVDEIDIQKMDVEGAEWTSVLQFLTDFPDRLPFCQLQIELHLDRISGGSSNWLNTLLNFWENLESAGLRPFMVEPNLLNRGSNPYSFWEIAFLNTKIVPFLTNVENPRQ